MKAVGLLGLRLVVGFIFIYSGLNKLFWSHEMTAGIMAAKVSLPGGGSLWAYIVGSLELLGGAMVVLGFWARYAASWLAIIMVVAMATVHRGSPSISGYFLPLSLLGSCLALIGAGAGKWRLVKTECHCKKCKELNDGHEACDSGCSAESAPTNTKADDGCCGGGNCSSGMEEKK